MVPIWSRRMQNLTTHACQLLSTSASTLFWLTWLQALPGLPGHPQPSPVVGRCRSPPQDPPHMGAHPCFPPSSGFLFSPTELPSLHWSWKKEYLQAGWVLPFVKYPFIWDSAQQVTAGRAVGLQYKPNLGGNITPSPGSHSLSPQLSPWTGHGGTAWTSARQQWKHCVGVHDHNTGCHLLGHYYQGKDHRAAAGIGMDPGQRVKMMWSLANRHGLGIRHRQSRRITHMACRNDNRCHKSPLFILSSSRRSYRWELCQNFPESQCLSKGLLLFHDSESKHFHEIRISLFQSLWLLQLQKTPHISFTR